MSALDFSLEPSVRGCYCKVDTLCAHRLVVAVRHEWPITMGEYDIPGKSIKLTHIFPNNDRLVCVSSPAEDGGLQQVPGHRNRAVLVGTYVMDKSNLPPFEQVSASSVVEKTSLPRWVPKHCVGGSTRVVAFQLNSAWLPCSPWGQVLLVLSVVVTLFDFGSDIVVALGFWREDNLVSFLASVSFMAAVALFTGGLLWGQGRKVSALLQVRFDSDCCLVVDVSVYAPLLADVSSFLLHVSSQ